MAVSKIALTIKCSECFTELEAGMRLIDYVHTLVVEPCEKCLKMHYDDGFCNGQSEGFCHGKDEGYLARDEELKDDIRAAVRLTQEVCAESKEVDAKTPDSSS